MAIRKRPLERLLHGANIALLTLFALVCVYPLYYVLMASVSDPSDLIRHTGVLVKPYGFTLSGFRLVFNNSSIVTGYLNTLFYVLAGTSLNMALLIVSAFVLSRRLVLSQFFSFLVAFTMFFSGGLIPYYLVVKAVGILNTRWALILPTAINAWNLIVIRTSFQQTPASLEESAHIDGCGEMRLLWQIIVPLNMPVVAVMILFSAVIHWNSWFEASILLQRRDYFPLQLILREILIANDMSKISSDSLAMGVGHVDTGNYRLLIQYCVVVVATLPILVLYPFLQRFFVKGIMIGALKG